MLTIIDCIALSDLTEAEIDAIAEHEHLPEMVAVEMGHCLAHCPGGPGRIAHFIADDIADACARGRAAHAVDLMHTLQEFMTAHPQG
ncbi:hypothetical protein [Azospirillum picis]|uniref:Protein tyrosine phosphatase n=1 Tax=Azospirillum picis TaxID=488438 RepID=A0ABU0MV94_9PROT|nr:hypothetical protein [Azospirillum picis]MBP2303272.1 protein tyrosine phosphatase [Azospirillum picis]MDQ0537104.1 protein tyrosine phosphatase [Azospirillum picis]